MKKLIVLIIICFIVSIADWGVCQLWTNNINVELGIKELEGDWDPVDSQIEYGVLLDFRQKTWPVNIAVDILHSKDEKKYYPNTTIEGKTLELDLGMRKIWAPKIFRPFVGGGIAFITGKYDFSSGSGNTISNDDGAPGIWINGGLYLTLRRFNIGIDLRWSKANVRLYNERVDAGGLHYGLIAGIHW